MSDATQLDRVALLARSAEGKAAEALAKEQRRFAQSSQQLQQLEGFRQEYRQRLESMAGQGMPVRQLQDYQRFLANLNDAIDLQSEAVARSDSELRQQRQQLAGESRRRDSLEQLVQRRRADEMKRGSKAEQLVQDEHSMRRHIQNQNGDPG